jgi:hypothetical protein
LAAARSAIQAAEARFATLRQDAPLTPPPDEVAEAPPQALSDAQRPLEWL